MRIILETIFKPLVAERTHKGLQSVSYSIDARDVLNVNIDTVLAAGIAAEVAVHAMCEIGPRKNISIDAIDKGRTMYGRIGFVERDNHPMNVAAITVAAKGNFIRVCGGPLKAKAMASRLV